MRYKLLREKRDNYTVIQQFLFNHGIELYNQQKWLDASLSDINSWKLFNEDRVREACALLYNHISDKIMVVVDPDQDGFAASAILLNYLYKIYNIKCKCVFHSGKQHGLSDLLDKIIKYSPDLLISPDGGTNDVKEHIILNNNNIDVLCLDHHLIEQDLSSTTALIINVENSDYPNKQLTGSGVVWQFCRAYSDIYNTTHVENNLIDLAALGIK